MNLQEVAKLAKVSSATVSRVLNNAGPVRASTRARVQRAIQELKYHPNLHARNLAGGKSRTLGMIVSNLENPFFLDIYRAAEDVARTKGLEIIIASTDYDPDYLSSNIRMMLSRRVAGLAVVVSEMDPNSLRDFSHQQIPVVLYDANSAGLELTNIAVNYARGIERVVHYLYELGHRRMGFVSHHQSLGPISSRERTFCEMVSRYAPEVQWKVVANGDGIEGGRRAARELLSSGLSATAIVCVNDFMALGVLHELRESGLRVPQDISVTGFDNIKLAEVAFPALTTLHIPREKIGQLMLQALTDEESSAAKAQMLIDPEFVVRSSTGSAPK